MSQPRWIKYNEWSGVVIRGAVPFVGPPDVSRHMHRAVWLTSQLEGAHWGTVQSYDGAGISAGLLHNVAVLPRSMSQGDLWAQLKMIFDAVDQAGYVGTRAADKLRERLRDQRWVVREDGVLRHLDTGAAVKAQQIRNEISPPNGQVPRTGPFFDRACHWATLFHDTFSDPANRLAQVEFAVRWLARGQNDLEMQAYRLFTRRTGMSTLDSPVGIPSGALEPAAELALCVYHSFSVNGPAPAATALRAALATQDPKSPDPVKFAKRLIRALGKSTFGRWHDEPGDGSRSRYDRTRKAVWGSQLWALDLSKALMPRDL